MNTFSHLIINAALRKKADRSDIPRSAFLLGAVAPDVPLGLLSVGFILYQRFAAEPCTQGVCGAAYDNLYFTNPWWIAAHNFLHSPTALFIYLGRAVALSAAAGHARSLAAVVRVGLPVHTTIDIATHAADGPVLLWPFEWFTRFHSPISYYDPAYFGRQFAVFERALDVALLGYLIIPRLIARFSRRAKPDA